MKKQSNVIIPLLLLLVATIITSIVFFLQTLSLKKQIAQPGASVKDGDVAIVIKDDSPTQSSTQYKSFASSQFGVSFEYPSDWVVVMPPADNPTIDYTTKIVDFETKLSSGLQGDSDLEDNNAPQTRTVSVSHKYISDDVAISAVSSKYPKKDYYHKLNSGKNSYLVISVSPFTEESGDVYQELETIINQIITSIKY